MRWALTLVALLASGAAGAAVPETQQARVQGSDASNRNPAANKNGAGNTLAGRTASRADASCDDGGQAGVEEPADGLPAGFAAEAVWRAHQLLFPRLQLPALQVPALLSWGGAPTANPGPNTLSGLEIDGPPSLSSTRNVLQPRAPPRA